MVPGDPTAEPCGALAAGGERLNAHPHAVTVAEPRAHRAVIRSTDVANACVAVIAQRGHFLARPAASSP